MILRFWKFFHARWKIFFLCVRRGVHRVRLKQTSENSETQKTLISFFGGGGTPIQPIGRIPHLADVNELSLDFHKSSNELSLSDLHKSGNE